MKRQASVRAPGRLREERDAPLVLKLGGSLAESGRLAEALAIAAKSKRRVVIVPGGGPFADAVRSAQRDLGFSDEVAHRMALLAMHQMAEVYFEMQPGLVPAETLSAIRLAWAEGKVPVWIPLRMATANQKMPRSWLITSDGLAAWLAERLRRADVCLMKSREIDAGLSAAALANAGIVDTYFALRVAGAGLTWRVLGPGDMRELAALVGAAGARAKSRRRE